MNLSNPIPVRISVDADKRLGDLAKANGLRKAELMRMCIERFLDEVEAKGKIEIRQIVFSPEGELRDAPQKPYAEIVPKSKKAAG